MDSVVFGLLREDIEKHYGVEPLSRSFIFDKEYAAARNRRAILSSFEENRPMLSMLLHEAMDEKRRDEIFPGKFDIGSRRSVAEAECTYKAVLDELYPSIDRRPQVNEPFESVKQGIKRLTGRSVAEFSKIDPLAAMKVVKLLYFISKTRSGSIFSILSRPETGKAGLEFRDAYPNAKNEELIWLVSDVREYLTADLTLERMMEIRSVFSSLLPEIERVWYEAERPIMETHGQVRARIVPAYDFLMRGIENFCFDISEESIGRLDETLYVYLSSLEFWNYAQIASDILNSSVPQIKVSPIADQLHDFARTMPTHQDMYGTVYSLNGPRPHECKFKVEDVLAFAHRHSSQIRSLMESALSMSVRDDTFRKCMSEVQTLLFRVVMSHPKVLTGEQQALADLPMIVAAFCAVQAEHTKHTRYEPFWHGKRRSGASLLESLRLEFSEKSVYEEHTQIWRIRLYLFQDAINGQLEWGLRRQQLKLLILKKVAKLTCLPDTKKISEQLAMFFHHVREQGRLAAA